MQDSTSYFRYISISLCCTKIMASGPITSWQIDEETMQTVRDFILLGSKITANKTKQNKITADGDCTTKLKDTCSLEEKL